MRRNAAQHNYVRLDHSFDVHPKTISVGPEGGWLFLRCVLYCARLQTDGVLPLVVALDLARDVGGVETVARLTGAGLLDRIDTDTLQVHDYADWQQTREQIESRRAVKSAAGKAGAAKRWQDKPAPVVAPAMAPAMTNTSDNRGTRMAEVEEEGEPSEARPLVSVADRCIATWEKDIGGPMSATMRTKLVAAIEPIAARGVSEARLTAALRKMRERSLPLRVLDELADEVSVPKPTNVPPPFQPGDEQPPEVAARGAALVRAVLAGAQPALEDEDPDDPYPAGG